MLLLLLHQHQPPLQPPLQLLLLPHRLQSNLKYQHAHQLNHINVMKLLSESVEELIDILIIETMSIIPKAEDSESTQRKNALNIAQIFKNV